jgi:hypothetical protein
MNIRKAIAPVVVVPARIGAPQAVEAIVEVLKHDSPGAVGTNRQIAAEALVWLGATDRLGVLKAAIADHERLLGESRPRTCAVLSSFWSGQPGALWPISGIAGIIDVIGSEGS